MFVYKTNLSELGLRGFSPILIIEWIVPAFPFPSYCMFSAALCKPGAEQLKRESEMGLGLRKKGYEMSVGAGCLRARGRLDAQE